MLTKAEFARRIQNACLTVIAAEEELTAIDAKFGDADHGFTMAKVCNAILAAIEDDEELEAVYSLIMDQLYEDEEDED